MIYRVDLAPLHFQEVAAGHRQFTVQSGEKPYSVGDHLALLEYDDAAGYSGRFTLGEITSIFREKPLAGEYCVLGFVPMYLAHVPTEAYFVYGGEEK